MDMRSKEALDKIIRKSRVHLYKPMQIAEILFHQRLGVSLDLRDLETYRNVSKKWRDEVSNKLVGRICTSSQKFQDNIFESNAMPPPLLEELGDFNREQHGLVEAYIYLRLRKRLSMVIEGLDYVQQTGMDGFDLQNFLDLFTEEPGLKRSVDKVYEIVVYSLFSTIVRALRVEVSLSVEEADPEILADFNHFLELVLGLSEERTSITLPAKLYRVGVTNAADRGLDMWANFGSAVQVKHISLSEDLAEDVSQTISADRIVLICLDAEAAIIDRITRQLPFSDRFQGIITLSDLKEWYSLCLSDKYKGTLGEQILKDLEREFKSEFPVTAEIDLFLEERGYSPAMLSGDWRV